MHHFTLSSLLSRSSITFSFPTTTLFVSPQLPYFLPVTSPPLTSTHLFPLLNPQSSLPLIPHPSFLPTLTSSYFPSFSLTFHTFLSFISPQVHPPNPHFPTTYCPLFLLPHFPSLPLIPLFSLSLIFPHLPYCRSIYFPPWAKSTINGRTHERKYKGF